MQLQLGYNQTEQKAAHLLQLCLSKLRCIGLLHEVGPQPRLLH